jgi:predicted peptidase
MFTALCLAAFLASCGGGGGSGGTSSSTTTSTTGSTSGSTSGTPTGSGLLTSAPRDSDGDVQVGDAQFVMEPEIQDWFYKVTGFPTNFNFHLYLPESYKSSGDTAYPLLIQLHGDDGYKETLPALTLGHMDGSPLQPLLNGRQLNPAGRSGLNPHVRESFVVAPEVPHVDRTGNFAEPLGYWNPNAIKKIIAFMQAKYRIDSKRIYVTGASMGGGGTFHVTNRSTNIVAAAVPMCFGYDQPLSPGMYSMPLWFFQSYDDGAVNYQQSLSAFSSLLPLLFPWESFPSKTNAPTKTYTISYAPGTGLTPWIEGAQTISGLSHYTLYPTGGHNAWDRTYANEVMWDWLYAQRKAN